MDIVQNFDDPPAPKAGMDAKFKSTKKIEKK